MKAIILGAILTIINLMWVSAVYNKTPQPSAVAVVDDCTAAFDQSWPAPPFECPTGQPDPECLAAAQVAYEQYMQMASFTRCESEQDAADQYKKDKRQCFKDFMKCLLLASPNEGPVSYTCIIQANNCDNAALVKYDQALAAATTQFYADMADAMDQFYNSAFECCNN